MNIGTVYGRCQPGTSGAVQKSKAMARWRWETPAANGRSRTVTRRAVASETNGNSHGINAVASIAASIVLLSGQMSALPAHGMPLEPQASVTNVNHDVKPWHPLLELPSSVPIAVMSRPTLPCPSNPTLHRRGHPFLAPRLASMIVHVQHAALTQTT